MHSLDSVAPSTTFLTGIVEKMINNKSVFGVVLRVERGDEGFSWTGAAGNLQTESRYFIASVTKLYINAIIMKLVEENRLKLEDKITQYLPEKITENLHVLKGVDFSRDITINHLISNRSGLPDYFFHKQANGKTAADELLAGKDESWHPEKVINLVKTLKPNFKPGKKGIVAYSDTNYQLLGRIIENITGKTIGVVFKEFIFDELGLQDTYAYEDITDDTPTPFFYKAKLLWLPRYIASVTPEGGIVSTAAEVMLFLKAFFRGRFFPAERIEDLKRWNLILPPPALFLYGIGLEKLWIPRIITPFKPIKEIIGFWGQTGSFAFYNSDTDLYFTGTTNQINGDGHKAAVKAMLKIIKAS